MSNSIIKDKSFAFALRVVKLYECLNERKVYHLSKQIMRSGTSVGANVREALNSESKQEFVHKLGIAQKECDETIYWLELIISGGYISLKEFESMNNDAIELLKTLKSISLTTKRNISNKKIN